MSPPAFPGTAAEGAELLGAIGRWCKSGTDGSQCTYGPFGVRLQTCAAHAMLLQDQRALNGLVWMRRQRARLQQEEEPGT